MVEEPVGGAAPVEGEEGDLPSLAADDPGRVHICATAGLHAPEFVSDGAGAPPLFLSEATGLTAAGGAAAAAEEGGRAPRSPPEWLCEYGRPCTAEEAEGEARRRGWSALEAAVVMECRRIDAGGWGGCSARWLELDTIAARMRRDLGDPNPGAYPVTLFLSRPEGLGARGAAAEAAFRRLSIVEERDEVVAALVAEFKAGERKRLRCWDAGRGSVCGVPFPGWEDWVREGRLLLWEEDLEELRSGAGGGGGGKSRHERRRGARRERRGGDGVGR